MPQKVSTNGTAQEIGYTALLNTQGSDIATFRFIVGLVRESLDEYMMLNSMVVEINSGIPAALGGYSNTIHPGSVTIPNNGWQVQEGDQFAVFVYNECTKDFCPANVNLINKEDCQSTLYQPLVFFPTISPPGIHNINKSDPVLERVPVKLNIAVSIGKLVQ